MKRGFKTTPKALAWGHDFYAVQVGSLDRKLVGFRVTPEQARRIDLMARASGMTKQDYLYKRALEEEVVVRPDVRVYKMLRDEMARVYRELRRIRPADEVESAPFPLTHGVLFRHDAVNGERGIGWDIRRPNIRPSSSSRR